MNMIGGGMIVYDVLKDEAEVNIDTIRFMEDDSIDTIRFMEDDSVEINLGQHSDFAIYGVNITEDSGDYVTIELKDLPNLIKALQKAQELWGDDN